MSGKKREAPVSYRPPESLREAFNARVSDSGLSVNAFITRAIFGQAAPRGQRRSSVDGQAVAVLLSHAARISDRLKTLPEDAQSGHAGTLEACHAELREIRTCLMRALGREP